MTLGYLDNDDYERWMMKKVDCLENKCRTCYDQRNTLKVVYNCSCETKFV